MKQIKDAAASPVASITMGIIHCFISKNTVVEILCIKFGFNKWWSTTVV